MCVLSDSKWQSVTWLDHSTLSNQQESQLPSRAGKPHILLLQVQLLATQPSTERDQARKFIQKEGDFI